MQFNVVLYSLHNDPLETIGVLTYTIIWDDLDIIWTLKYIVLTGKW